MVREQIIKKAYQCIDEVYPDSNSQDITAFNIDTFLDQAAKIIIKVVPTRALGAGIDIKAHEDFEVDVIDGVGFVTLPPHFQRLVAFQASDWKLPVTTALYSDSPQYLQQSNEILRGTPYRPIVFILNGGENLEFYTSKASHTSYIDYIKVFRGIIMDIVDDTYPEGLVDITAWKTAELTLSAMNDVQAAQICQTKVQEILGTL